MLLVFDAYLLSVLYFLLLAEEGKDNHTLQIQKKRVLVREWAVYLNLVVPKYTFNYYKMYSIVCFMLMQSTFLVHVDKFFLSLKSFCLKGLVLQPKHKTPVIEGRYFRWNVPSSNASLYYDELHFQFSLRQQNLLYTQNFF